MGSISLSLFVFLIHDLFQGRAIIVTVYTSSRKMKSSQLALGNLEKLMMGLGFKGTLGKLKQVGRLHSDIGPC